jgi:hypothetical protein
MSSLKASLKKYMAAPPYVIANDDLDALEKLQRSRIEEKLVDYKESYPHLNDREQKALHDMRERGYHVCENYLSEEEVTSLDSTIAEFRNSSSITHEVGKEGGVIDWLHGNFPRGSYRVVENKFRNSEFLQKVIESYIAQKMLSTPEVIYQELSVAENKEDVDDIQTVLHADRFYSSVKVFYMVNDHTPENGAFWFSPGSQVMDDFRVKYELDYARRVSKELTGKKAELSEGLLEFGRSTINHELTEKFPPQQLTGKKNSLLIVDVCGFHKRGLILAGQNRQTIRMIYHYMHAPVWSQQLFKLLGKEPARYLC